MSGAERKNAIETALKYLSYRPRSVAEVASRLREKGFCEAEISAAIERLAGAGCVDDEKFAFFLADSRVRNKNWGSLKIALELESKGISRGIIEAVASSIDSGAEAGTAAKALERWMKKNRLSPPLDKRGFERAFRHLKGRGFQQSAIFGALKKAEAAEE